MTAVLRDVLSIAVVAGLPRLALFGVALLAHRRWQIPIAELERLIRACFPAFRNRRPGE